MSLYLGETRIPVVKAGSAVGTDEAVLYTEQVLNQEQKKQARKNIEAASTTGYQAGKNLVTDENGTIGTEDKPSAVLYIMQTLSPEEQEQVRKNINAASPIMWNE